MDLVPKVLDAYKNVKADPTSERVSRSNVMANKVTKTGLDRLDRLDIVFIGCLIMLLPLVLLTVAAFVLVILAMLGSI